MLKRIAFCPDSCIVKTGEKFVHDLGTWEHLEGVPIGSDNFENHVWFEDRWMVASWCDE
jgi:hypothetical protein